MSDQVFGAKLNIHEVNSLLPSQDVIWCCTCIDDLQRDVGEVYIVHNESGMAARASHHEGKNTTYQCY